VVGEPRGRGLDVRTRTHESEDSCASSQRKKISLCYIKMSKEKRKRGQRVALAAIGQGVSIGCRDGGLSKPRVCHQSNPPKENESRLSRTRGNGRVLNEISHPNPSIKVQTREQGQRLVGGKINVAKIGGPKVRRRCLVVRKRTSAGRPREKGKKKTKDEREGKR